MANVRGGRVGIEDELVGAAMQISAMRQEIKTAKTALESTLEENEELKKTRKESLRAIEHLEAERELMRSTHAKELEDIKKNESDALDTAKEAFGELKKRAAEVALLKAELSEVREAAAAAAAAAAPKTPAKHRRVVIATGAKPVGSAAGEAGAKARGARYAMDEEGDEEERAGGKDGEPKEGGDEANEEDDEEEHDDDDDDDDDGDGKGGGFFGWLTGSARKKRRRGE